MKSWEASRVRKGVFMSEGTATTLGARLVVGEGFLKGQKKEEETRISLNIRSTLEKRSAIEEH